MFKQFIIRIDSFLDRITMYSLILYELIALVLIAAVLSFFGLLPFNGFILLFSTFYLVSICWITNGIFSSVYNAPTNFESAFISGLILSLIISPINMSVNLIFLAWAAIIAMAAKYILAINKKHIFNPVAISVLLTAIVLNQSASWWVGNVWMMPFVILFGILIVRKIRKGALLLSFTLCAIITIFTFTLISGGNIFNNVNQTLFHSSLFFFAFFMLSEPLTTPPIKALQIYYGAFVGVLFAPQIHVASIYSTPELALVLGNIFSYLVSPKQKFLLHLREKIAIAADTFDFLFIPDKKLAALPGQYMEWTLPQEVPDSRGNRRYFTLASSPTEEALRIGVKFYQQGSSYKKALLAMDTTQIIVAGQLAGDFTLPKNKNQKLAFIAGGIGITPFRSMIKYLLDTKEKRDIVLFYANKTVDEITYADIFTQAQKELTIKTVYTLTDMEHLPQNWNGKSGRISEEMIREETPDYRERMFYISGPHTMVVGFEESLSKLGVKPNQVKKDFFPGYA